MSFSDTLYCKLRIVNIEDESSLKILLWMRVVLGVPQNPAVSKGVDKNLGEV